MIKQSAGNREGADYWEEICVAFHTRHCSCRCIIWSWDCAERQFIDPCLCIAASCHHWTQPALTSLREYYMCLQWGTVISCNLLKERKRKREKGQNVALLSYQGRSILAFLLALQHKTKVLRQSSQCRSVCSCIAEPPNNPLAAGSQDKGQAHPRDTSHMRPSCKFAACHRKPSLHWASLPRNGSWHCLQECICWQRCWQHR